jgi:hypothetical protein
MAVQLAGLMERTGGLSSSRDSGSAWGRRETDDYNAWASLLAVALR